MSSDQFWEIFIPITLLPLKEIFYNKAFKKRLKCSFLFDGISTHGYKSSRERQDARKKWTFN